MNLNQVEFSLAQSILLKLVQYLTPLAQNHSSGIREILRQRFFIPSFDQERAVQWLPAFQSLEKKLEEIIGKEEPVFAKEKKGATSLTQEARGLLSQVQKLIAQLCHSEALREPCKPRLQAALKQLRPGIHRLIESLQEDLTAELN